MATMAINNNKRLKIIGERARESETVYVQMYSIYGITVPVKEAITAHQNPHPADCREIQPGN